MKDLTAQKVLDENTKTWNEIADEFELTRHYTWDLAPWIKYVTPGMKVLDLGCGNGRLFELLKDKKISYTGIDNSKGLITSAKEKYKNLASQNLDRRAPNQKFLVGDALELPFKNNSFDLIYSVAVLHVIPSKKLRLEFLKEARRVLKKDGKLVLTVWNLWQRKYFPQVVKHSLLKIVGKSKLDFGDLYISWQNKYQRYHHAITRRELKTLLKKAGFNIEKLEYLKRNRRKVNVLTVASKP